MVRLHYNVLWGNEVQAYGAYSRDGLYLPYNGITCENTFS